MTDLAGVLESVIDVWPVRLQDNPAATRPWTLLTTLSLACLTEPSRHRMAHRGIVKRERLIVMRSLIDHSSTTALLQVRGPACGRARSKLVTSRSRWQIRARPASKPPPRMDSGTRRPLTPDQAYPPRVSSRRPFHARRACAPRQQGWFSWSPSGAQWCCFYASSRPRSICHGWIRARRSPSY